MGWARTLFLGDIGNRLDIEDTERDIAALRNAIHADRSRDESQDQQIARLMRENEQLELCVAALVRALKSKGILSDEEVRNLTDIVEEA